jgi:two-component system, cell cycle response regulator DivK
MAADARILIVEDNADNMMLMEYLLRARGYEPSTATDGADGVRIAADERPDLILLDVQMPGMNGYEVAAAVRGQPEPEAIRIVAVTAFAMVGDQERIMASGFDGYLTKPIMPETFVRDVERFLPPELRASSDGWGHELRRS